MRRITDQADRERRDREYADMARSMQPSPAALARRERLAKLDRELHTARKFRKKLGSLLGRVPNHRQIGELPPVGREPKWRPYSDDPDWYTPQDVEQYSEFGSRDKGIMSMRQSHALGHPEMPNRGDRAVTNCESCQSSVYRRHRRKEMKQDVVSWLGGNCTLCHERKTPMEYRIVRLWGGKSNLMSRLHHAANDIEYEARTDYVLVCHPCWEQDGPRRLYEKARKVTAFADPPSRKGRPPKARP